jgi:prephenate dehydrogenase
LPALERAGYESQRRFCDASLQPVAQATGTFIAGGFNHRQEGQVKFGKVTILGVGLLGGSLGQALKKRRLASEVFGWGRNAGKLKLAKRLGALDAFSTDLAEACREAELIVLATPISTFEGLCRSVSRLAPKACLVTDVGSVKGGLVTRWEKACRPLTFVGSHPMAGSEKTGVAAARPNLFEKSVCITTPTPWVPRTALGRIEGLWKAVGCRVVRLKPAEHDRKIGLLSHLPHAAAFALVAASAAGLKRGDHGLAGNGFRDTTRVGASDAGIWSDIFLGNRAEMLKALSEYQRVLSGLAAKLKKGDAKGLWQFLHQASETRQQWK